MEMSYSCDVDTKTLLIGAAAIAAVAIVGGVIIDKVSEVNYQKAAKELHNQYTSGVQQIRAAYEADLKEMSRK